MSDSFPCIVCGCTMARADDSYEAQPGDGVMCTTHGNYGSTVYDPMDGAYLSFNICDKCLVEAGEKGRVMEGRDWKYVQIWTENLGKVIIGKTKCYREFVNWTADLPDDGVKPICLEVEEVAARVKDKTVVLIDGWTVEEIEKSFDSKEDM
jgi:hypothetical protein